jgi:hypothetical protein
MDAQTRKAVVANNLKNWYAIDSILFNEHARNIIKEGKVFQEYVALKASLLSNLYEYWQHAEYSPSDTETPAKVKTLQESAVQYALKGKMLASDIMNRDKFKTQMKSHMLQESKNQKISDIDKYQEKYIQERFMRFAIDNCLIGLPLLESNNPDAKCDFECKILTEGHRKMRDHLVRLAMTCKKQTA